MTRKERIEEYRAKLVRLLEAAGSRAPWSSTMLIEFERLSSSSLSDEPAVLREGEVLAVIIQGEGRHWEIVRSGDAPFEAPPVYAILHSRISSWKWSHNHTSREAAEQAIIDAGDRCVVRREV